MNPARSFVALALLAMLAGRAAATVGAELPLPAAPSPLAAFAPLPELPLLPRDLHSKHLAKVSGVRVAIYGVRDKVEEALEGVTDRKEEKALEGVAAAVGVPTPEGGDA